MKIKNKKLLKGIGFLAFILVVIVIFSDLLVGLFNLLVVKPVLTTINSSLLTDISFILLTALIAGALFSVDYKKYGIQYRLQSVMVCCILLYVYQRIFASHYTFAGFSLVPQFAYADLLLLLPLLYLWLVNLSLLRKSRRIPAKGMVLPGMS